MLRALAILGLHLFVGLAADPSCAQSQATREPLATNGQRQKIDVTSSLDGTMQVCYLTMPVNPQERCPMVVSLHSWSADVEQRVPEMEKLIAGRNWVCLQPNFRGINDHPQALASPLAQQDILDAVDWVLNRSSVVDPRRIYLVGVSGGGHMTMMMAAKHPERWRAASAWVGICDLAQWHARHRDSKYGAMMRKCCGGAPGDSASVDQEYRLRSPKTFLKQAHAVALDIAAGIHDGHQGSVPVRQSLEAFNEIAGANRDRLITEPEIEQLSQPNGRLKRPSAGDEGYDPTFEREFYLRRHSGHSRVTLFEGGHEGIATAVMAWFDAHP